MWWKGVARLCDQTVLHALLTAGKVDLGRRVCFLIAPAMASAGVDMAGSAAGSDQNSHDDSSCIVVHLGRSWGSPPLACRPQNVAAVRPGGHGLDGVRQLHHAEPLQPAAVRAAALCCATRSPLRPMFTITPISASSKIRLVPPEEKKGSEMPVLGRGVGHDGDVAEHLPRDLGHDADAHQRAEPVLGLRAIISPLHDKQHEQHDDEHCADEAQLLAHHAEDEVVGAFRQPELLFPHCCPAPGPFSPPEPMA